jgi:hypothetical protein
VAYVTEGVLSAVGRAGDARAGTAPVAPDMSIARSAQQNMPIAQSADLDLIW